ncbi:MAG TPA: hypothetical protein VKR82_16950 [Candidatus Acidoferrales bacterium]|nr:hypothetical protein [Candidatus Acidoferrales bacterium]
MDDVVSVEGLEWCEGKVRRIGLTGLTSKILCTRHNNALSEVDVGGIKAFDTFRQGTRLSNVRSALRPRIWQVERTTINGPLLERWLLKTLINFTYGRDLPIGRDNLSPGKPSEQLVRIAFGLDRFVAGAGLYIIGHPGQKIFSVEKVSVASMLEKNEYVAGGFYIFRGNRFVLYLDSKGLPEKLTGVRVENEDWGIARPVFHPTALRFNVGKHLSHVIEFVW